MFNIKNVSKKYESEYALNSVSLTIGKGMNFITGASGSGKSTILKILSGFIKEYEGEVTYKGKDMKDLSKESQSYMFNSEFGFVWQEFNLIENASVLENIMLPTYLKEEQDDKYANKLMSQLKIASIANQKVNTLSGGQKQRVAIAREMMKKPNVIFADEPTSALDKDSVKNIMDILRSLSKNTIVIIVTHDTSLIKKSDHVYELDKGELISSSSSNEEDLKDFKQGVQQKLGLSRAFSLSKNMIKNSIGRSIVSLLTLVVASTLLFSVTSGSVSNSSQSEFDKLFDTYGGSLLDLSIVSSFTDAVGTGGEESKKPKGDVSQNIEGLYSKYINDPRVSHISFLQAFDNIEIKVDGKQYPVQGSGNSPVLKELIEGKMPGQGEYEVVVPESFVKSMGSSNKEALGKTIEFSSSIYKWENNTPIAKQISIVATIVGVADTTATYENEGRFIEFDVEDSFFFNKEALDQLRDQAGIKDTSMNFTIRANTPNDLISLKNELNKSGIVPLGYFELVEDLVDLNTQTSQQSGSVSVLIAILATISVAAVSVVSALARKREFSIYNICGYTKQNLRLITLIESLSITALSIIVLVISSPLLNMVTGQLFNLNLLNITSLSMISILLVGLGLLSYMSSFFILPTNILSSLNKGDQK